MPKFSRLEILNTIVETGLVPVFYHSDTGTAISVARAMMAGGCRLLEFTNRGDFAVDVFRGLSQYCQRELPEMILGVGTIMDAPTAALYVAYGANFVVGPTFDPDVARFCNGRKIAYIPGCGSANEIARAEELGVEIVKVFPGDSVGGPAFVKAIRGPRPWTLMMPTGGVDASREGLEAWFKAGVTAVGVGGNLIKLEYLETGNYTAMAARATEILALIRDVRS